MFTTDLALKFDPSYREIAQRFQQNPEEFRLAYAKAWFKLTHRDLGPRARYLGSGGAGEVLAWQDPVPAVDHPLIDAADAEALKAKILASGIAVPDLVRTAWASAASFRGTDMRGGANGARLRLAPQKDWAVNDPAELARVLARLEAVQQEFNRSLAGGKKVSLADVIVLGGNAAIEKAAKDAGYDVRVPFTPGRTDATQAQTDVESFAALEPAADGFRNYLRRRRTACRQSSTLVDRANMLTLTVPEMTFLFPGEASGQSRRGVSSGPCGTRRETPHSKFARAAIKSRAMTSIRASTLSLARSAVDCARGRVSRPRRGSGRFPARHPPCRPRLQRSPAPQLPRQSLRLPSRRRRRPRNPCRRLPPPWPPTPAPSARSAVRSVRSAAGHRPWARPVPSASAGSAGAYEMADAVLVDKSDRRLYLLRGGRTIAEYPIKLGLNPYGHKQREGDFRTPEGKYRLDWRNPDSEFYLSIKVSYPNREDAAVARERGDRPGGLIMLHGQPNVPKKPPEHYATRDWTDGCIALSNADMTNVWLRTTVGIPIEIRP